MEENGVVTSESGGETAQPVGSLAHRNERAWNKIPILAARADLRYRVAEIEAPARAAHSRAIIAATG